VSLDTRTRRSFLKYLEMIAEEFGLRDWQLYAHFDEDLGDGVSAATACVDNRRVAHVKFAPSFFNLRPEEQRETVLHELLHVHMWQITDYVREVLPDLIGKPAFVVMEAAFNRLDEQATDAIAAAIGDRYPLWVP